MVWVFDSFELNGETHVYRRLPVLGWVPWVRLARSDVGGRGVFASRRFAAGEVLGRYTGRILGREDDANATRVVDQLEARGSTMLYTVRLPSGAWYLDGARNLQSDARQLAVFGQVVLPNAESGWPGMLAHYINSSHGTGRHQNVYVAREGWVTVEDGAVIEPGTELLQNYGDAYHQEMTDRGTARLPYDWS